MISYQSSTSGPQPTWSGASGARPSGKKPSRYKVADFIEHSDRSYLPSAFRDALVAKFRSGKRFTEFKRSKPLRKHLEKSRWRMTIAYLCHRFYDLIVANQGAAVIGPFGIIEIPVSAQPISILQSPGKARSRRGTGWGRYTPHPPFLKSYPDLDRNFTGAGN